MSPNGEAILASNQIKTRNPVFTENRVSWLPVKSQEAVEKLPEGTTIYDLT